MPAYESESDREWAHQIFELRDRFEAEQDAREAPTINRMEFIKYLIHIGQLNEWWLSSPTSTDTWLSYEPHGTQDIQP